MAIYHTILCIFVAAVLSLQFEVNAGEGPNNLGRNRLFLTVKCILYYLLYCT